MYDISLFNFYAVAPFAIAKNEAAPFDILIRLRPLSPMVIVLNEVVPTIILMRLRC